MIALAAIGTILLLGHTVAKNKFLGQVQEKIRLNRKFAIQQSLDMAVIALHEEFGFGEDRVKQFCNRFHDVFEKYASLCIEGAKDDRTIEYSKAKLDAALNDICGDDFVEWDKRYDFH